MNIETHIPDDGADMHRTSSDVHSEPPSKNAVIIAILNHKGGVGKTTTAVNLAGVLARHGKECLVLDLDAQANATRTLGIDMDNLPKGTPTISNVLSGEVEDVGRIVLKTSEPHLFVAPSDLSLSRVSALLHARHFRENLLRDAVLPLVKEFDYILIDCPPTLDILSVNALVAASRLIIPCELSGNSLHALGDLLATVRTFKPAGTDFDYRILVTNLYGHAANRQAKALKLLEPLEKKLLRTQIRRSESIERSQMPDEHNRAITPLVLQRGSSRGALDYRAAGREVMEIWT